MKFRITGISFEDLNDFMNDLVMCHDIRTFKMRQMLYNNKPAICIIINKKQWLKTWRDVGCKAEDTKEWLETSFKEELEGQDHKATVELIE